VHDAERPWPNEWIAGEAVPEPREWGKPGVVLAFSVECAGCVARAVPWLRDLSARHGEALVLAMVHTAYAHHVRPRDEVIDDVERVLAFTRTPLPVALDGDGSWAQAWGAEGTPHWFAFDAAGSLVRSVYGSQANAITRLDYLVEELLAR
jgi:hypothetical protein